jgi:hypothetical protein
VFPSPTSPQTLLHSKPPRVESHEGVSVTPSPRPEREGLSKCMRGGPVTNQQTIGWGVWGRGEVFKSCGSVLPKRHIFVPVFSGLHEARWEKDDLSTADSPLSSFFVAVRMPLLWVCSVWTAIRVLGAC